LWVGVSRNWSATVARRPIVVAVGAGRVGGGGSATGATGRPGVSIVWGGFGRHIVFIIVFWQVIAIAGGAFHLGAETRIDAALLTVGALGWMHTNTIVLETTQIDRVGQFAIKIASFVIVVGVDELFWLDGDILSTKVLC